MGVCELRERGGNAGEEKERVFYGYGGRESKDKKRSESGAVGEIPGVFYIKHFDQELQVRVVEATDSEAWRWILFGLCGGG